MGSTIDMQFMRYLNLFGRITKVNTRHCFRYNEALIFCVPKHLISKAIGENANNIKQISKILNKKIKIIALPKDIKDAKLFISSIIAPVSFKNVEITPEEIILTAGSSNKAALIGRNKRRLLEMQKIIKDFFKRYFRIV